MHARDQWFRVYEYTPGEAAPVLDSKTGELRVEWTTPPAWGPVSDTMHVHHADAYHPDLRVRVAHHRAILRTGAALSACGAAHDPRMRFVEAHDPKVRCGACVAATEKAKDEHAAALAALEDEAALVAELGK